MKMPNFGEAHCGEGAEQSMQTLLEFVFWISESWKEIRIALCVVLEEGEGL
jgi:hypothetical protein